MTDAALVMGLSLPSCQHSRTEAAHIGPRGLSTKVPDRQSLSLCNRHHVEIHDKGPDKFWTLHRLDPEELIRQFNARFDAGERA